MSRKAYSRDSIERALHHHELKGALLDVSPPGGTHPGRWRVRVTVASEPLLLTMPQAYVLCLGLAAAERAYSTGGVRS